MKLIQSKSEAPLGLLFRVRGNYCISAHFRRGQGGEKIISPALFSSRYLGLLLRVSCIADEVPEVHLSSSNLQLFLIFL